MRKAIGFLLLLGAVAICAVTIAVVGERNRQDAATGNDAQATETVIEPDERRTLVKVAVVQPRPITEYLLLPGTVEAWEDIDLSAKAGGTLEWIGPEEGDRVSSGEAIMRLDVASLSARVNQAQAQLVQAKKQYERIAKLVRDHVAQPAELDNTLAQRDVAQANLEMAQVNLDNATLCSPIDGVVDRIHVDRGEHVREGNVVAKIVQADRVKILVNVPEKDIRYFREGQDAMVFPGEVSFEQIVNLIHAVPSEFVNAGQISAKISAKLPEMVWGKIYYVALTADPLSRTYPMHIAIDNRDGRARPGMIVRVGLVRRSFKRALTAPLYAVVDRGDRKAVFVEQEGRAVQRDVALGIIEGTRVQIVSGLAEGDRLIVVGQRDLVHGEEVKVEGDLQP